MLARASVALPVLTLHAALTAAMPALQNVDVASLSTLLSRQQQNNDSSSSDVCQTNNGADPGSFQPPLYTESYRPQIHFSPSSGFMNDPNGLVRSGDTWHLYFQYNPNDTVAGFQHWGHATSTDLYHWQNHLPAIAPDNDEQGIFSGSAVLDVNDTSGFFDEATPADSRFVAIYTLNTPTSQDQNIAYSTDGQNYTKFSGNPVISLNTTQFRDPKVFYDDDTSQWVMTVAHPQDYQVGFYASKDLKSWTELSRFGPAGVLGYQYECPDLLRVPIQGGERDGETAWVLVLSINPGAPQGGSAVQAFIGEWDGTRFTPFDGSIQIPDFGKEFYATSSFYNAPDGKAIAMTWASNWQYTNTVPTSPWRSVMTVPRELTVRWTNMNPMHQGYQLTMQPYNLDALNKTTLGSDNGTTTSASAGNQTVELVGDGAFEINATFLLSAENANASNPRAEMRIGTSNAGEYLNMGVLFGNPATMYVDRRFAGQQYADSEPLFTDRFSQQFAPTYGIVGNLTSEQRINIHAIVDRTITEAFAQDGVAAVTVLHYWDSDARPSSLNVSMANNTVTLESLKVQAIQSTWPSCA
jgi:beta-fructofuranosidase